jgi:hypothetical protein
MVIFFVYDHAIYHITQRLACGVLNIAPGHDCITILLSTTVGAFTNCGLNGSNDPPCVMVLLPMNLALCAGRMED